MDPRIVVVGMGPGSAEHLTRGTWQVLREARHLYLRTDRHPTVQFLRDRGLSFTTLDHFYQQAPDFPAVYRAMAAFLVQEAGQRGGIVLALPGHPRVGEDVVAHLQRLAPVAGVQVEVMPALSALDVAYVRLELDPLDQVQGLDATGMRELELRPDFHYLVLQVYDRMVAAEVKLALMEVFPDEHPVWILQALGHPRAERIEEIPLLALDRVSWLDHLTSLYVPPLPDSPSVSRLKELVRIMEVLRAPGGCPWDREQDHVSLRPYLLEEAYEVVEALDEKDPDKLQEELGDLLLQVVFHAQIAREEGTFELEDVARGIVHKLVRRHPHVFSNLAVKDSSEVVDNWQRIKQQEPGRQEPGRSSRLDGIPRTLPALMRAAKVQERAARVGFDWPNVEGAWEKLLEEVEELGQARKHQAAPEVLEDELGDVLFAAVNVARLLRLEPETALSRSTDKFARRFHQMETRAVRENLEMEEMDLYTLEGWWQEAKKAVKEAEEKGK